MTQRANIQTTAVKALENSAVAFAGSEKKWAFAFFFEAEQLWKNARLYDAVAKSASRAYFINADLLWPQHAPWVQVFGARNDMAYINLFRRIRLITCTHRSTRTVLRGWMGGRIAPVPWNAPGPLID